MYVCIYVYACICMYVRMYMCMYLYIYLYIHYIYMYMFVCMYVYTYVCIVACSIMSGCSEEVRRQFFLPPPDSAISLNLSMHTNVESSILHTNFGSSLQLCFSCDDGTRIENKY